MAYIVTSGKMDSEKIFGKDTNKILKIAHSLFHDALGHRYDNCYRAPRLRPSEFKSLAKTPEGASLPKSYMEYFDYWNRENPEEVEKEKASRKARDAEIDTLIKKFFGIAKRHHVFILWYGTKSPCCPDKYEIYYHGKSIGKICC